MINYRRTGGGGGERENSPLSVNVFGTQLIIEDTYF